MGGHTQPGGHISHTVAVFNDLLDRLYLKLMGITLTTDKTPLYSHFL